MFLVFQDVYLRLAVRISASVLVAALFGPVKGTDGGSAFSQKQEIIFWKFHRETNGLGRFKLRPPDFRRHRRAKSPPSTRARVRRGALVPPASNPIVLRHVIERAGGAEARAARMRPGPGFCALSVREVGHAWAAASGGHRRNGQHEPDERGKNRNQIPADCALAGCAATLGLGIAPFSSGTRSGFGRHCTLRDGVSRAAQTCSSVRRIGRGAPRGQREGCAPGRSRSGDGWRTSSRANGLGAVPRPRARFVGDIRVLASARHAPPWTRFWDPRRHAGRGCIVRMARAAYSCRTEATRRPLELARALA